MIKKVTYENIKEGASAGIMAFHVEIDNKPQQGLEKIVTKILNFPTAKQKLIVLNGESSAEMGVAMYSFIMTLKDKGFHIQANIYGKEFYPWFTSIDRLVMHVTDVGEWLTFSCHEFVLHATGEEAPLEPSIPEDNQSLVLSFDPGKLSVLKVYSFLNKAVHNWRIYPVVKKSYVQVVYKEET